MKIVILWTDAMVFLLLAVALFGVWRIRQRPHLILPWQRVAQNRLGMISLLILSSFFVIGMLDSLHYRVGLSTPNQTQTVYSPEVLSAFDALTSGLRSRTEKTYSAPLATHLYAKESIDLGDGKTYRDFPRLVYGGAHLQNPATDWLADVVQKAGQGALAGALVVMVLVGVIAGVIGKKSRWAVLIAALILAVVIGAVANLSHSYHVFGTDKVGQDVLYLALKSIRTGLVIGTVTTLVMLPFALFFGIAAGYFRGWVDDIIQYVYTVLSSIPSVLLIAASVLMMQVVIETHAAWFATAAERADVRLLSLCVILGVTSWTGLCRLLRGETLKLREMEYIQAAQSFGVSSFKILTRHLLPNLMHIVLISVVMEFSALVLAEAVLSYVGVGVDPSTISFGTLINAARMEMGREPMVWWTLAAAFSFMLLLVLSANLFADAVRDAFDPRMNRS